MECPHIELIISFAIENQWLPLLANIAKTNCISILIASLSLKNKIVKPIYCESNNCFSPLNINNTVIYGIP